MSKFANLSKTNLCESNQKIYEILYFNDAFEIFLEILKQIRINLESGKVTALNQE